MLLEKHAEAMPGRFRSAMRRIEQRIDRLAACRNGRAFAFAIALIAVATLIGADYAADRNAEAEIAASIIEDEASASDFDGNPLGSLASGVPDSVDVKINRLGDYGAMDGYVAATAVIEERFDDAGITLVRTYRVWPLSEGGALLRRCLLIDESAFADDVRTLMGALDRDYISEAVAEAVRESRIGGEAADAIMSGRAESVDLDEPDDLFDPAGSAMAFEMILEVGMPDGSRIEDSVWCLWDGKGLHVASRPDGITSERKGGWPWERAC